MILQYFVTVSDTGDKILVEIDKSTTSDEAKTDELAKHYIRDFGAIQVFAKQSGGPIMLMIADNAALSLFNTYLS